MKITYKGDYALKSILQLALQFGKVVTIQDLGRRCDVPIKFLEQILLDLKRGGFIESKRGKDGGYYLSKLPSEISVGEIVQFIDGPLEPIACVESCYKGCQDAPNCLLRRMWQKVAEETHRIVDGVTFEDLVVQTKKQNAALNYTI